MVDVKLEQCHYGTKAYCYLVRYEEPPFSGEYDIKLFESTGDLEQEINSAIDSLCFIAGGLEFPTTEEEQRNLDKRMGRLS